MIPFVFSSSAVALLVGVVLGVLVLPLLLGPAVSRLIRRRPHRRLKHVSLAGVAVLLAASVWSAPTVSAAFALAAPVQFAVTPVREALA